MTPIFFKKIHLATIAAITSIAIVGCSSNSDSKESVISDPEENVVASSCFWVGPYKKEIQETNFAFPDTGARYWTAGYNLPEGASLKLNGEFPYARYMSINSYRADASPAHSIADNVIIANTGSENPFVDGSSRLGTSRDYTITMAAGDAPDVVPPNTVYDHAESGAKTTLLYRIYVPDEGQHEGGGVNLPSPELTLSDGSVLTGTAACDTLNADPNLVDIPSIPPNTYAFLRSNNPAENALIEENQVKTVKWRAAYNAQYANQCSFLGQCDPNPVRQVGWFANNDNQYVSAFIDRNIKPIVVIRGKIPNTPTTLSSNETVDESQAQLRYWSICQNEYYSQKVTDCLYDEQITINADGKYTIVTSLIDDKPENATNECGVGFLPWSAEGDGFGKIDGFDNNETDGFLIARNMLPMNGFSQTAQNTTTPGDEAEVMGDYLPTAQYFTKAEFEALGCDTYTAI